MHVAPAIDDSFHESRQPGSARVVLALNEVSRLERIGELLVGRGYEVVALRDGASLLQYLYNSVVHESRPDLVICDAELEGVDGAQICMISRAQNSLLPFIVIARPGGPGAFDSMELSDDAVVLPADVDLDDLKAAVSRLL